MRRTPLPEAPDRPAMPPKPRPYRLPRQPGAGRVVAPALPFSDTDAVRLAAGGAWHTSADQPQSATVSC